MRIGCIIQARTSSTRLPEKVLKSLPYGSDITVLQQVIRRVKKASKVNEVIVATTTDKEDEKIIRIAEKENVKWFTGSKENVLERYYLASKENKLDHVVRITSDCPCIDWEVVDKTISQHLENLADYTSNSINKKYPHGIDIEVFRFSAIEEAYKNSTTQYEKEHVTPYIYRSHPEKFKIYSVEADGPNYSDIRITLDTNEDYILLSAVFDFLYPQSPFFGMKEIVALFKSRPWLYLINKNVYHKRSFNSLNEELLESIKILELLELDRAKEVLKGNMKNE